MSSESQNSGHHDEESEVEEDAIYHYSDDYASFLRNPPHDSHSPGDSDSVAPPPVYKRPRVDRSDRLSALPESLIVHILSFLPILDSIRTGVLSRKWQYLWTCLPTLSFNYAHMKKDFDFETVETSDLVSFVDHVDKTLVLCDGSVKHFAVNFPCRRRFASNVDIWSRFASKNRVERFELDFELSVRFFIYDDVEFEVYDLPQFLYIGSKFSELRFSLCRIEPKIYVSWNSLKKLSIGYANLSDDVIQMIIAGTPVLEMLELHHFKGITKLHMADSSVKRLVLRESWRIDDCYDELFPLEIRAPNVQSLEISGHFLKCELVDVKSLVEASLLEIKLEDCSDYETDPADVMANQARALLDSVAHVKTLTLGTWVMEGLALLHMKGLRPRLLKCDCLTIDTELWKLHPRGIALLLNFFPFMETLILTTSGLAQLGSDYQLCNLEDHLSVLPVPLRGYNFLRTVKLFCYWLWMERESTLKFVEILLKNARMLRKMIIHTGTHFNRDPSELFRFSQKLLSFRRSSPHAEILVYESMK